jgi:hypothetical protein
MGKTLIHSNAYLKDTKILKKALDKNIGSSSAVEGIRVERDARTGDFMQKDAPSEP